MSQLQSSVGLVTGFPIQATVQKLMLSLNQAPVTAALQTQDTTYQNQVTAIMLQLQALSSRRSKSAPVSPWDKRSLYTQTNITSSNAAAH